MPSVDLFLKFNLGILKQQCVQEIPGHYDVIINETADYMAKRGIADSNPYPNYRTATNIHHKIMKHSS